MCAIKVMAAFSTKAEMTVTRFGGNVKRTTATC